MPIDNQSNMVPGLKNIVAKKGRMAPLEKGSSQYAGHSKMKHTDKYEQAYAAFDGNDLLKDPFWINQFALKKCITSMSSAATTGWVLTL